MLGGPKSGLTAKTSTPGEATAFAAVPIFAVIEAVVFGLTTTRRIRKFLTASRQRPRLRAFFVSFVVNQFTTKDTKEHEGGAVCIQRPTNRRPSKDAGRARP